MTTHINSVADLQDILKEEVVLDLVTSNGQGISLNMIMPTEAETEEVRKLMQAAVNNNEAMQGIVFQEHMLACCINMEDKKTSKEKTLRMVRLLYSSLDKLSRKKITEVGMKFCGLQGDVEEDKTNTKKHPE